MSLGTAGTASSGARWSRRELESASRRPIVRWGPAWPLKVLILGYPVFWALGLGAFAAMIMAVPMAVILSRRRPIRVPRGFILWILFLLWTVVSVTVLGFDPPGTIPDSASGRLLGYGMREVSYLSVTVILLYVGNLTEEELPQARAVKLLGWFFVWVVLGGLLGVLAPTFEFTSLFELLLPHGISSNHYVQHLVHPAAAQVQEFAAGSTPRPAAPFDYTNTWGFHLTLLGVWFVLAWCVGQRLPTKLTGFAVLATGLVLLVLSLNRAAWLGVAVTVAYVVIRLAAQRRLLPLMAALLAVAVGTVVFSLSPLQGVVQQRLDEGKSDDIRSFTTQRAIELSLESPVIGYGSTRSAIGSASSIAVGKSPECPQCGNISIGINGYAFMLLMTTGWVGAGLFFGFLLHVLWRSRGDPSPTAVAASTVVLLTLCYGVVYDVSTSMLVPFLSLAILWREQRRQHSVAV